MARSAPGGARLLDAQPERAFFVRDPAVDDEPVGGVGLSDPGERLVRAAGAGVVERNARAGSASALEPQQADVEPIIRRRNSPDMDRRTHSRNSGNSAFPHTQFAKSWVVAMSTPMMAEKPTDAVLESMTVPFGSKRADEFASPSSLTISLVS